MSNKQVALKLQKAMKDLGYKASLGHSYEILSKISGEKSWNVAKAKSTNFSFSFNWVDALKQASEDPNRKTIDLLCLSSPPAKAAGKSVIKFAKTLTDDLLIRLVKALHENTEWSVAFLADEDMNARLTNIYKHLNEVKDR